MAAGIDDKNYTGDHILLCLANSPASGKVIGIAAEMATAYQSRLSALLIETPAGKKAAIMREDPDSGIQRGAGGILREKMELAGQPGAQISLIRGRNIARQISGYAKANNVTKIATGYSINKYVFGFCCRNNIDKITRLVSPAIEVYVIN